jgi:curli biogenesis system outer membrane secretion channel CsgG
LRSTMIRTVAVLASMALLLAVGVSAGSAAAPTAQAAKACSGNLRNYSKTSYMFKFRAAHISCASSRKVAKAFQRCRGNAKARCHHKVYGYSCKEKRSYGFASFDSKVTCKKGRKVATHVYTDSF